LQLEVIGCGPGFEVSKKKADMSAAQKALRRAWEHSNECLTLADNVYGAYFSYMWEELEGRQERSVMEERLLQKILDAQTQSLEWKDASKIALQAIADDSAELDKVYHSPLLHNNVSQY
jgi:hypothetical protein